MLSFLSELHVYVLYLKLLEDYRDYQESSVLAGFLDLAFWVFFYACSSSCCTVSGGGVILKLLCLLTHTRVIISVYFHEK